MEDQNHTNPPQTPRNPAEVLRHTDPDRGLGAAEVRERQKAGAVNVLRGGDSGSVWRILLRNICTLFNLINFLLALGVCLVGYPKQALFFGVAIANTVMGIVQELRSKRTLDKLNILTRSKARLQRDGVCGEYDPEAIVTDDVLLLSAGDQIPVDGVIVRCGGLETDESLLTGEADSIRKQVGDAVLSGSFVNAGHAAVQVTAVGEHSYANSLTKEAKKEKRRITPLMRTLNNIIRALTIAIIPLGVLLFFNQLRQTDDFALSLLGMTTGVVGMIPEGLVVLTTITLTVGALRLTRRKALVQALPSIETLARVDVLCLDKTGTITDGTLQYESLHPYNGYGEEDIVRAVHELMQALEDENATAKTLRAAFSSGKHEGGAWRACHRVPFSSLRKWSGAAFEGRGSYVLGAPDNLLGDDGGEILAAAREYARQGYRVLCLAHSDTITETTERPEGLRGAALLLLSDKVRDEATEVFRYFADEGVTLKVISGDDALTAAHIAAKAGIDGAENAVDLQTVGDNPDYGLLSQQYTVFGRVSPAQKRELIRALQEAGHTTCMTGDGVNDVLAMKEAGCSVAMMNGSGAARGAADFVLLTSNFAAMVDVLREGRKVINNIENVAALYLVKTIYSTLLTLLYSILPYAMPYAPLHITPVNVFMVGLPSFLLALRPNYEKPGGEFVRGILTNSLPAGLTVVLGVLYYQAAAHYFNMETGDVATMCALYVASVMFSLVWRVSYPRKNYVLAILFGLGFATVVCFTVMGWFFGYTHLFSRLFFFYLPMMLVAQRLYSALGKIFRRWFIR